MSSFLSFIFVIRICDFAAKEACSVVEKWKWNCVGYAQFPDRSRWAAARKQAAWATQQQGLSPRDPDTDICQNNFPRHIKMLLALLCYSDASGDSGLENGDCRKITAIHVGMVQTEEGVVFPAQEEACSVWWLPVLKTNLKSNVNESVPPPLLWALFCVFFFYSIRQK